jgi:hypothetical protein
MKVKYIGILTEEPLKLPQKLDSLGLKYDKE